MAIPQEALIERVRSLCLSDRRLDAALTYGSFVSGEGDRFSDIEFWLFFTDDTLANVNSRSWCERIAPVSLMVLNEFGTQVAIFKNLVRGEFHFAAASEIDGVRTWPGLSAPVDEMVIVDHRGALTAAMRSLAVRSPVPSTAGDVEQLCGRFVNWVVFGWQVLQRGELLRALHLLDESHRYLLWMARLTTGATQHWLTPSRLAEHDLPQASIARYVMSTAPAQHTELLAAYRHAVQWGCELTRGLAADHGFTDPGPVAIAATNHVP